MDAQDRAGTRRFWPIRWRIGAAVLLLHLALVAVLIRAFTPDLAQSVARSVTQAFSITATPPKPPPRPATPLPTQPADSGGAAPSARKATPRPAESPTAPIVITPTQAPPIAGTGTQNAAGAAERGQGTGAGGIGSGLGSGDGGSGTGGGAVPTVKIAGDINSAKDYPRRTRDLRVGHSVTIDLGVGSDGRVTWCRVVQPSPDPAADSLTCSLAADRFRFRPARDSTGLPKNAVYRWRQRWFY